MKLLQILSGKILRGECEERPGVINSLSVWFLEVGTIVKNSMPRCAVVSGNVKDDLKVLDLYLKLKNLYGHIHKV